MAYVRYYDMKKTTEHEAGPEAGYRALLLAGELQPDISQSRAVNALERLHRELLAFSEVNNRLNQRSLSLLWPFRFLTKKNNGLAVPKGVYLYGGVGRGKSMLMDLFFQFLELIKKNEFIFMNLCWKFMLG